ncbi:hypothetical protein [Paenibacillus sp. NPDC058071]|uniref:hypothetical protein n=1 Tax=Paenibacillus sp. NPDC058071 TaxID=3346326 RepID=UPI0036DCAD15
MSPIGIKASFGGPEEAREAQRKLQSLRAFDVGGLPESGLLTVTVDEQVVDRAVHLISQIGGNAEMVD